jgi:UDP-glucose 4-epimerase
MSIFGDGTQSRAFSYVGDVAPIMVDSISNKNAYNKIFNIGADKPYSVKELAERVAHVMGVVPKIKYLEGRNEVLHAYSDHSKLQKVFKYKSKFDLDEGLKRMAKWAQKTGSKESKKFDNIEIIKNLPKSWRENK